MPVVTIIIPVVRPEKADRCIKAIGAATAAEGFGEGQVEVVSEADTDGIGCPKMVAQLVAKASSDLVLFLGDDTIPQPGFLSAALKAMAAFPDGWGLVALNDGIHDGRLATHWLAHKRLLEHIPGGEFFHSGYNHCFCDKELTDIAQALGRYTYALDAVIVHDHPHVTGEAYDEGYKKAYAIKTFEADQKLYWLRKIERVGGLAIGFPLTDKSVPAEFATSMLVMDKPAEWKLLVPRYNRDSFPASIAAVRNDLVEQALDHGCSHLLMCDTDQVYPADTLARLVAHEKPIVGVAVHRRWPPFDRILMRGELGAYESVPDEEAYSGRLVPVDATGTGCVLFDTRVFLSIPRPWFELGEFNGAPLGEDISFCSKARAAGIPIYVDTSVEVDHLSTFRVNAGTARLFKAFNQGSGHAARQ